MSSKETYTYDPTYAELATFKAVVGSTSLYGVTYTRDALGRIATRAETIGGTTTTYGYTYDGAQRLESVSANGVTTAAYTYDPNGNRSTSTGSEAYDGQDRLTQASGAVYAYSAQGDLVSKTVGSQVTSYTYDGAGSLHAVTLPSGEAIAYVVDGAGRRIGKEVNGTLTAGFLYRDSLKPIVQLNGSGAIVSRFAYGTSGLAPDYMINGGTTYRFVKDERGSVRLVVNASTGAVAEEIDYDAWGVVTNDTNPGFQPFGYAGGLYDADTGLVRFGMRDYDASVGRWTNKDPARFRGGANLYVYGGGDPVNHVDPTGQFWMIAAGAVGGAALGAGLDIAYQLNQAGCASLATINWAQVGKAGLAGGVFGAVAAWGLGEVLASQAFEGAAVNNPIPTTLARVIPANIQPTALGLGQDVFVTDAAALNGLDAEGIADALGIPESPSGFNVYESLRWRRFGVANRPDQSGIRRTRSRLGGGAPEFVIPNGPIPNNVVVCTVP